MNSNLVSQNKPSTITSKLKRTHKEILENRKSWFKIWMSVIVTGLLGYKLVPLDFSSAMTKFDFSDLMSLLLAIFSIGLSIAFYFKATDTSNTFHNNTYRFTKDVSEILGRVEAGFGEKLQHLNEGYTDIKTAVEKIPYDPVENRINKKALESSEKQVEEIIEEKEKTIKDLAEKAKLNNEEKDQLFTKLTNQDAALERAKVEISNLKQKLDKQQEGAKSADSIFWSNRVGMAQIGKFLKNAKLRGADLMEADLKNADLMEADLRGAYLMRANLSYANLMEADLTDAKLMEANLRGADLSYAKLMEANLSKAYLTEANLMRAKLLEANLYGVDLRGARNLTVDQLCKTKTLYQAKLDPELLKQVKAKCPHLLEKPKKEEPNE